MSMLQYRHKSRAWNAMVAADEDGVTRTIKDKIAQGIDEGGAGSDRNADIDALMDRLRQIRARLSPRIPGMPDDASLIERMRELRSETVRSLVVGGAWDTLTVGGEEVDIDIFDSPVPPEAPGRTTPCS